MIGHISLGGDILVAADEDLPAGFLTDAVKAIGNTFVRGAAASVSAHQFQLAEFFHFDWRWLCIWQDRDLFRRGRALLCRLFRVVWFRDVAKRTVVFRHFSGAIRCHYVSTVQRLVHFCSIKVD